MLCQAYAFFPVSTNQSGTASRALIASRKAARSLSSSRRIAIHSSSLLSSRTRSTSPDVGRDLALAERDERTGPAQAVQATGTSRADAPDWDSQRLVDPVV